MSLFCGIDIGGTGVKTLLMDAQRNVLSTAYFLTESENGAAVFLETLGDTLDRQLREVGQTDFTAIGIGCTGPVDIYSGVILNPFTLNGLEGLCITEAVSKRFRTSVYLENDANTAHLGEAAMLADDPGNTTLMILGTGVGCSIRVGGVLFRVPGGIHPEMGHTCCGVESDVTCYCGKTNCMENILSGTAINRDAHRFFGVTPEDVMDRCDTPEKAAFRENLIRGLVNAAGSLAGFFDSKVIFLAGGMQSFCQKYLLDAAQARLNQLVPAFGMAKLVPAQLGADSGRLGAAILAQERFNE